MFPCVRWRTNVVVLDILADNVLATSAVNVLAQQQMAIFRKPRILRTPTTKATLL
jgi:hypothetical protein